MKNLKIKLLTGALCAALVLSLAACTQTEGSSTPQASATPEASEATPAPETDPTPAPEESTDGDITPTAAPEGENETHGTGLPAPEAGSPEFVSAFAENPIDAQYASDMEIAGSVAQMVAACNTASESWQAQIESVYTQILERGSDDVVEQATEDQSHWVNEQSTVLEEIRESVSEEDSMAALTVAENIMLYYRSHAIELCATLYEIDGAIAFG